MMSSTLTTATTTSILISLLILIGSSKALSSSSSSLCPIQPYPWLDSLQFCCPVYFSPLNSPIQIDGEFLDRTVAKLGSGYIAVLFHASWCPFSSEVHPMYETLSFMFPEIEHLTIEQSSVMPSVLSRYGIHSFPAILIVSHSSSIHYRGPRDLPSLVEFYKKTTGTEPVQYMTTDYLMSSGTNERSGLSLSVDSYLKEILSREPYLAFSVLFIVLRFLHYTLPGALAFAKSVWHSFVIPQMNWEIFGETSQIFGRALHMLDVKRFWTKLKVRKNRSFHQRARSASVWASSIASISVGEKNL